eukprot:gb/GECG01013057.1/.p1 GENE.gb/GECG01013057.1/~~gb/GECG01013057.1/.p1  ORF type:complete len:197 (+),score=10.77 gb/GECG01013057.1/:1-591(+)
MSDSMSASETATLPSSQQQRTGGYMPPPRPRSGTPNKPPLAGSAETDEANHNVSWMHDPRAWVFYAMALVTVRMGITALLSPWLTDEAQWICLNVFHFFLSFIGLHWARGTPIWEDQGEFEDLTVWEQVDNGIPWTTTKKVLMIIPVILFLITCHATDYEIQPLIINGILNTILVVAKLPEMHRVRIFGVNRAKVD